MLKHGCMLTGKTDEEHLMNLEKVFNRLQEHGLHLKQTKGAFMSSSVEYLGYMIDVEEIKATPKKVEAISKAPQPKNKIELRSFLGLVNYYGKFIPQLASVTQPLNHLLCKKTCWKGTAKCERAFTTFKAQLTSTKVLVHYDVNLPLRLACDASAYGVGAVISHVMKNDDEKPIAYASCTLTKSEKNYPQIKRKHCQSFSK